MLAKRKRFTMLPPPEPPTPPLPELLSVRQLASRLGCGEGMVRRRVLAGAWESVKVSGQMQFAQEEVVRIMAERTAGATNNDDVA